MSSKKIVIDVGENVNIPKIKAIPAELTKINSNINKVKQNSKQLSAMIARADKNLSKSAASVKSFGVESKKLKGLIDEGAIAGLNSQFKAVANAVSPATFALNNFIKQLNFTNVSPKNMPNWGLMAPPPNLYSDLTKLSIATKTLGKQSMTTAQMLGKMHGSFLGIGMSMMFMSMALKRVFTTMTMGAINSFKKIIATTNNQSSAINQLGAQWEYLKFSVGSALNQAFERIMPQLIRVLSWAADWAQQHPEAVFIALIGGITALTGSMVMGQLITGLAAILGLMYKLSKMKAVDLAALKNTLGSIGKGLGRIALGAVGAFLVVNAAIDIVTNWLSSTYVSFVDSLKSAFSAGLGASMLAFAFGASGAIVTIAGVAALVMALAPKIGTHAAAMSEFKKDIAAKLEEMGAETEWTTNIAGMPSIKYNDADTKIATLEAEQDLLKSINYWQNLVDTKDYSNNFAAYDQDTKTLRELKLMGNEVIPEFAGKMELLKKSLDKGIDTDPVVEQMANLSNSFGATGTGLNESIAEAVENQIPALWTAMDSLSSVLKSQEEQLNRTAGAMERYNRALDGATEDAA